MMRPMNRREYLWRSGGGLGGIALAHLLGTEGLLAGESTRQMRAQGRREHMARRARAQHGGREHMARACTCRGG